MPDAHETFYDKSERNRSYAAFLSYRHDLQGEFVRGFELHLKRFARRRFASPRRIFRDEQHISAGQDLAERIRDALERSEWFILLASPEASCSPWVQDELRIWCEELGRSDKLIIVLVAGVICEHHDNHSFDWASTDALPEMLSNHVSLPFWVDMRRIVEDWPMQIGDPVYRKCLVSIISRLERKDPNAVDGAEWRIRRRETRVAWIVAALLFLLLGVTIVLGHSLWAQLTLVEQRLRISESQRLAAASTALLEDPYEAAAWSQRPRDT